MVLTADLVNGRNHVEFMPFMCAIQQICSPRVHIPVASRHAMFDRAWAKQWDCGFRKKARDSTYSYVRPSKTALFLCQIAHNVISYILLSLL